MISFDSVKNADLHCHSNVSDGLLTPAAVVERALDNGVDLLALTDHDEVAGLAEARVTAEARGLTLVNGVEISIEWASKTAGVTANIPIHVVGLGVDARCPALTQGLETIRNGRYQRAERMAAALDKIGLRGCLEGALRYSSNPTLVSRAHFARFLVESGVAADTKAVFDHYLVPGKPGYVEHRWATLDDALGWIRAAGGVAVVAHPGRYKMSKRALRRFMGEFKDGGGVALEVVCGSHTTEHVKQFARYAREFGLAGSRGSDYHGPGESYVDIGCLSKEWPEGVTPVWAQLL